MSVTNADSTQGLSTRRVAFERGQVIIAGAGTLAGAVAGWAIPKIFEDPRNLSIWLVAAASILVAVVLTINLRVLGIQREDAREVLSTLEASLAKITEVNADIYGLVEESIGRQAELIPRELVYRDMATSIRNAQREVAVITYLMVDWNRKARTFLPAEVGTPYRGEFYDAVYEAIRSQRIEYVRVWQVPQERRGLAMDVIMSDPYNAREYELIQEVGKDRPDKARLVIANQLTTASFVFIDRRHLFFNIDFYDPVDDAWHSPYMLFIKDATGDSFEALQSVIVRLMSPRG